MTGEGLTIDRQDLEQLAGLLLDRAGLKITPDGYYGLRLALQARMPALGLSDASEYVRRLKQLAGEHELRSLLPLVTVGKTEFFRDQRQFSAFENDVFPRILKDARHAQRKVRIWSAGCATGEEPYSLAMVALEKGALPDEVEIWATDLNPAAVEAAARGEFPVRRLVGVSEERLARFFTPIEGGYQVVKPLRDILRFEGHNLAAPFWPQVIAGTLDIIFCRNVIIYFDQPTIVGAMERFHEALRPGGWLFLGYSESLFKFPNRFEMTEVGGVFLYLRAPGVDSRLPRAPGASVPRPVFTPPAQPRWVTPRPSAPPPGAVRAAPGPVPAPRPSVPPPAPTPGHRSPVERLTEVVNLIEAGDFPRALRSAHLLVEEVPDDLAARLTLGNVHALMGAIDEARDAYAAALAREPLSVDARLFLGIAALQAGHLEDAKVELTRALFLEPTLALGHYLLGQVLERKKDDEGARRAYRNAMAQRKAPHRELLAHFPDLPRSNEAIAQAAQYRLAALSER